MTVQELVERDLRRATIALANAKKRPGVTEKELAHLQELLMLREAIVYMIGNT